MAIYSAGGHIEVGEEAVEIDFTFNMGVSSLNIINNSDSAGRVYFRLDNPTADFDIHPSLISASLSSSSSSNSSSSSSSETAEPTVFETNPYDHASFYLLPGEDIQINSSEATVSRIKKVTFKCDSGDTATVRILAI